MQQQAFSFAAVSYSIHAHWLEAAWKDDVADR